MKANIKVTYLSLRGLRSDFTLRWYREGREDSMWHDSEMVGSLVSRDEPKAVWRRQGFEWKGGRNKITWDFLDHIKGFELYVRRQNECVYAEPGQDQIRVIVRFLLSYGKETKTGPGKTSEAAVLQSSADMMVAWTRGVAWGEHSGQNEGGSTEDRIKRPWS